MLTLFHNISHTILVMVILVLIALVVQALAFHWQSPVLWFLLISLPGKRGREPRSKVFPRTSPLYFIALTTKPPSCTSVVVLLPQKAKNHLPVAGSLNTNVPTNLSLSSRLRIS